ncbi:hypothetical protein CHARACLAT_005176 [Characodon lateralis]|uniref:Uncharacterized protein n=1 Tax=Characodon lateralis TaxID=208331 RepID=A0ABU7DQ76_9TELE|nr:hypothetical protein [Characodon lateralis]
MAGYNSSVISVRHFLRFDCVPVFPVIFWFPLSAIITIISLIQTTCIMPVALLVSPVCGTIYILFSSVCSSLAKFALFMPSLFMSVLAFVASCQAVFTFHHIKPFSTHHDAFSHLKKAGLLT